MTKKTKAAVVASVSGKKAYNDLRDAVDVLETTIDELIDVVYSTGKDEAYGKLIDIAGGVYLIQREIRTVNVSAIRDAIDRTLAATGEALKKSYGEDDVNAIIFERVFVDLIKLAQMVSGIRR